MVNDWDSMWEGVVVTQVLSLLDITIHLSVQLTA